MLYHRMINVFTDIYYGWRDADEVFRASIDSAGQKTVKKTLMAICAQIEVFAVIVENFLNDLGLETDYVISPSAQASCMLIDIEATATKNIDEYILDECSMTEGELMVLYDKLMGMQLPDSIMQFVERQRIILEKNIDILDARKIELIIRNNEKRG